jgi:hypothetical protein
MNERIWDKFLTERDKAVFAVGGFGGAGRIWQATGAACHRRQLGVLRRAAGAHHAVNQALAYLMWRRELGGP